MNQIIPIPKIPITVRPATMDDLPFIDGLQKKHSKQVGFLHREALEGKVKAGHVLIAEERDEGTQALRHEVVMEEARDEVNSLSASLPGPHFVPRDPAQREVVLGASVPIPIGYLIGNDQYFKRDDVGIIYQMNVVPERRRSLVGATLLKAMFDRAAWGCRLFCCWCAQDIEANRFWESMGFVPLAFRAGGRGKSGRGKGRVHIFWQKRIRAGDAVTPWWFPSQTSSGSIREDRIVLPIPPGVHWSDPMPRVLPEEPENTQRPQIPAKVKIKAKASTSTLSGLTFKRSRRSALEKSMKRQAAKKNEPRLVAAAREMNARWMEYVNSGAAQLEPRGKYDVTRALPPVAPPIDAIGGHEAIPALPAPLAA
jgi:hypothetical protein